MAIACRKNKTSSYVPVADRSLPREQRTTFPIRSMSARALAKVKDAGTLVSGDGTISGRIHACFFAAVKYGVGAWDNLPDETGAKIEPLMGFDADGDPVMMDESIDRIRHLIEELAGAVLKENGLTERDLGNSSSSPASGPAGSNPTTPATSNSPSSVPSATDTQLSQAVSSAQSAAGAGPSASG